MRGFVAAMACVLITSTTTDCVGAFNSTNKLLESLNNLQTQVSISLQCYRELTEPVIGVARFFSDISEISQNLTELDQRNAAVLDLADAILKMPGVNSIGAPALMSLTSGLTFLSRSIESVYNKTSSAFRVILSWEEPMKTLGTYAVNTTEKLADALAAASKGKQHVSQVAKEISMLQCGKTRSDLLSNVEAAAYGMDSLPNMVISELEDADDSCRAVKNFFEDQNSKINQEDFALKLASAEIQSINTGLDPIEKYLSEINSVLNRSLCPRDISEIINNAMEIRSKLAEELLDFIDSKAEDFVDVIEEQLKRIGLQKMAAEKSASNSTREKREACVTVRQILEDSKDLTGQNKTVVNILLRETFQMTMPRIPRVSRKLKSFGSTLQPFQTDFDLGAKVNDMVPSYDVINNFLAMDYVMTFWERPAQENMVTLQICEGEEKLRIPEQL